MCKGKKLKWRRAALVLGIMGLMITGRGYYNSTQSETPMQLSKSAQSFQSSQSARCGQSERPSSLIIKKVEELIQEVQKKADKVTCKQLNLPKEVLAQSPHFDAYEYEDAPYADDIEILEALEEV